MSRAKNRPRRGNPDSSVLIEGDEGIFAGPLGGAAPGATESGDLASREFGVPQADIPGGVRHLVNPQTRHARPPGVPERPADYHKEHGVEPLDDGQYVVPPDATEERPQKAQPEPVTHDAIPVYIVETPGKKRVRRDVSATNITVAAQGTDPSRICNRDEDRVLVMLLCDDASNNVRFSEERATLLENKGVLLINSATSYLALPTQGELWATSTSTAAKATLNVILVTEVQE